MGDIIILLGRVVGAVPITDRITFIVHSFSCMRTHRTWLSHASMYTVYESTGLCNSKTGGVWSLGLRVSKSTCSVSDSLEIFVGSPFLSIRVRGSRGAKFGKNRRHTSQFPRKLCNSVSVVWCLPLVASIVFESTLNLPGRIIWPKYSTDSCKKNYFLLVDWQADVGK